MKILFVSVIILFIAACSSPHREHRMTRMHHHHDACNKWEYHNHDDQHGSLYSHTHCMDVHP